MTRKRKLFAFFLWHRRLGLAGLLLVFILSITGIMLNHTEAFKLDETHIKSDLLLDWYGINPQGLPSTFKLNEIWVSQWEQQLFFNGKAFFTHEEALQGIAIIDNIIAIALQHHILLADTDGEVIELFSLNTIAAIKKIGLIDNKIALLNEDEQLYLSNSQLSSWKLSNNTSNPVWSQNTNLDETQTRQLKTAFRGDGLNLEKFILDLHSGRIFNDSWGLYIMDASAVLMMLLGISGVWVWWTRKLKMRKKKHFRKHH
jgi:hypothetical protein